MSGEDTQHLTDFEQGPADERHPYVSCPNGGCVLPANHATLDRPRPGTEPTDEEWSRNVRRAEYAFDEEHAALAAGTHVPAVDDFGNQYLAAQPAAGEGLREIADKIDSYCDRCGGDRWVVTADPDEFGEPGEPYQVDCLDSLHACADQVRAALQPASEENR